MLQRKKTVFLLWFSIVKWSTCIYKELCPHPHTHEPPPSPLRGTRIQKNRFHRTIFSPFGNQKNRRILSATNIITRLKWYGTNIGQNGTFKIHHFKNMLMSYPYYSNASSKAQIWHKAEQYVPNRFSSIALHKSFLQEKYLAYCS